MILIVYNVSILNSHYYCFVFASHQPKTSLELEVAAMLGGSDSAVLDEETLLTPAEMKAMAAMSVAEARLRRHELQKYRALLSYKETKARRQNKIKSKK